MEYSFAACSADRPQNIGFQQRADQGEEYVPLSHPFVERLIGTIRREYLDKVPFWNGGDLERKLQLYKEYFNRSRPHQGRNGALPDSGCNKTDRKNARLDAFRWKAHCHGLYQLP